MFFKKPVTDYSKMTFEEVVKHFFDRGVPGGPGVIKTQEELNDALQGHRSAIWEESRPGAWLAQDIKAYLMLQGYRPYDIKPTNTEKAWSRHQMYGKGQTSPWLLLRTKLTRTLHHRR